MRSILAILFIILYFSNYHISEGYYPLVNEDWQEFKGFWQLRSKIYELMFLVLVLVVFTKKTALSTGLFAFAGTLVIGSVIDKWLLNIYGYDLHDLIVIPFGVLLGTYVYARQRRKKPATR